MNEKRLELAARRGALQARCAEQRQRFATAAAGVEPVFAAGDAVLHGVDWLKRHPLEVGGAVALAVIAKPRRLWRWGRSAFVVWRGWQALRSRLSGER